MSKTDNATTTQLQSQIADIYTRLNSTDLQSQLDSLNNWKIQTDFALALLATKQQSLEVRIGDLENAPGPKGEDDPNGIEVVRPDPPS